MSIYRLTASDGTRLGSVWKFVGNPPAERWVAFSAINDEGEYDPTPAEEVKASFPTRAKAVEWLQGRYMVAFRVVGDSMG